MPPLCPFVQGLFTPPGGPRCRDVSWPRMALSCCGTNVSSHRLAQSTLGVWLTPDQRSQSAAAAPSYSLSSLGGQRLPSTEHPYPIFPDTSLKLLAQGQGHHKTPSIPFPSRTGLPKQLSPKESPSDLQGPFSWLLHLLCRPEMGGPLKILKLLFFCLLYKPSMVVSELSLDDGLCHRCLR